MAVVEYQQQSPRGLASPNSSPRALTDDAEPPTLLSVHPQAATDIDTLCSLTHRLLFSSLLDVVQQNPQLPKPSLENACAKDALARTQQTFSQWPDQLKALFPSAGIQFDYIPRLQCPVNIPAENELFPEGENESHFSGLDLVEDRADSLTNQRPSTWPSAGDMVPPRYYQSTTLPTIDNESAENEDEDSADSSEPTPPARATNSSPPERGITERVTATERARISYCTKLGDQICQRLNLPPQPEVHEYLLNIGARDGLAGLEREKRRIKFVLRKYDTTFEKSFGVLPTRSEKEPMRSVYVYYRKVKLAIDRFSQRTESETPHSSRRSNSSADSAARSLEELERKLERMVAQKNVLAKRLQAFQEMFERKNGRRIRFHRDIVEIDSDYRKYKKLRSHVAQLTETVKARRALLTARGENKPFAV